MDKKTFEILQYLYGKKYVSEEELRKHIDFYGDFHNHLEMFFLAENKYIFFSCGNVALTIPGRAYIENRNSQNNIVHLQYLIGLATLINVVITAIAVYFSKG